MTAARGPGTPEFDRRALQLVDEALELPPELRLAHAEVHRESDPAMYEAVAALLRECAELEAGRDALAAVVTPALDAVVHDWNSASDEAAAADVVGAHLSDRFSWEGEIGRGGHAVVYLARDVSLGRKVAIKVMRLGGQRAERPRFLQESRLAAQLRHPYIVPVLESGEVGDFLFYIMPFVDGESLADRLERAGPLSLEDTIAVAADVAEALDFAHAHDVVHRDVKPQNCLLSGGHTLVTDFGIALALDRLGDARLTQQDMVLGTPAYMSPEQVSGDARVDGRSDVYALGCMTYEMLTGEVPYPGLTPRAVVAKHLQSPVPHLSILRPSLPAALQSVIERALAKVSVDRYQSATAFVQALRAAAAPGALAAPVRRPQSVPWRLLVAGVAVAGVAWWLALGGATAKRPAAAPAPLASPPGRELRRIAVLYFDNLSGDAELDVVARGLTEDLIDELQSVRGLVVISPNGVRPFRDRPTPVDSIGRVLGVGSLFSGSVSGSDSTVRATVRMIDAGTGEQLESQSFQVQRTATLALRGAVAEQVASFLRTHLGQEIRLRQGLHETTSLGAWRALRAGDEMYAYASSASNGAAAGNATDLYQRADSLYTAAAAMDPAWSAPLVGLGWTAMALTTLAMGQPGQQRVVERRIREAEQWAERAVATSGGSPQALALRGYVANWRVVYGMAPDRAVVLRRAEADLRAALDQRPDDARSWSALGGLLANDGRSREAAIALKRAYDGDAWLTEVRDVVTQLFFLSLDLEAYEDADRWCSLGQRRFAGDPRVATCRVIYQGWTARRRADVDAAWQELARVEAADSSRIFASQWGFLRVMVAAVAARAGLGDSAASILRAVDAGVAADSTRTPSPKGVAYVTLLRGDTVGAKRMLATMAADSETRRLLESSPWFRGLFKEATAAKR